MYYNLHHVCVYVCVCVRAFVTQFPLKLLQLHIFGKLLVLMNFYALQYLLVFVNFGLLKCLITLKLLHIQCFLQICCSGTFPAPTTWSVVWKCISIVK